MKKILIITDMGRDIDDTLALLSLLPYLKEKPQERELVGIIASGSETDLRGGVVRGWLRLAGFPDEKVPILVGRPKGVKGTHIPPGFPKPEDASLFPNTSKLSYQDADCGERNSKFIVDLARKHKKDLTITTWGPLTTLADALKSDKEGCLKEIGEFHMQGQADMVAGERLEPATTAFNIAEDVEAAKLVFDQLQDSVPISMCGKHSAYAIKLSRTDFLKWDSILEPKNGNASCFGLLCGPKTNAVKVEGPGQVRMIPLVKHTMGVFRSGNPTKFAQIYGDLPDETWFDHMEHVAMPYDALAMLMMFEPDQYQPVKHGKHKLIGMKDGIHDLTSPDAMKQLVLKKVAESLEDIAKNIARVC